MYYSHANINCAVYTLELLIYSFYQSGTCVFVCLCVCVCVCVCVCELKETISTEQIRAFYTLY
jgi:hypothetical protein